MKGVGVFVTPEELSRVRTAQQCSGMFLSGGRPMGAPQWEVLQLCKTYGLPLDCGLNLTTGEFVEPRGEQ